MYSMAVTSCERRVTCVSTFVHATGGRGVSPPAHLCAIPVWRASMVGGVNEACMTVCGSHQVIARILRYRPARPQACKHHSPKLPTNTVSVARRPQSTLCPSSFHPHARKSRVQPKKAQIRINKSTPACNINVARHGSPKGALHKLRRLARQAKRLLLLHQESHQAPSAGRAAEAWIASRPPLWA